MCEAPHSIPPDVQRPAHHLTDGRRHPLAPARGLHLALVQRLGDGTQPFPIAVAREDLDDDRRLLVVHLANLASAIGGRNVPVAVDLAAGDEPHPSLAVKVLSRALRDPLALQLSRKVAQRDHHLGHRAVEHDLLAGEVVVEVRVLADRSDELAREESVAAEARLVTAHDRVDFVVLNGPDHGDEAGPAHELCAADAAVDEDVTVLKVPSTACDEATSAIDLRVD